ncbi:Uncharacterised protein [Mycobacteroides abscessus subsp. massiliense]|nr:Uncharacterised protein [Mycobacteroides abscessus subsp. massiliense]
MRVLVVATGHLAPESLINAARAGSSGVGAWPPNFSSLAIAGPDVESPPTFGVVTLAMVNASEPPNETARASAAMA